MGDRLGTGKLSRYVTSHPGQLSLAIPLWVGEMSTSLGWQVTVGLASHRPCVTDNSGLSTYGLNILRKGDKHPPTLLRSMALLYLFTFTLYA